GGGIRTHGTKALEITNAVFMHNSGMNIGGGIRAKGAIDLTNVTFYNNSANDKSGAIDVNSSSTINIRNCIIYGNHAPSGPDISGTPAMIRNSLIGGNFYDGSGKASPMAAPLFVNAAAGDLTLQIGAPMRNMGDVVFFNPGQTPDLSAITTDIAGVPRIVNGQIDPGAYQSNYPTCTGMPVQGVISAVADSVC